MPISHDLQRNFTDPSGQLLSAPAQRPLRVPWRISHGSSRSAGGANDFNYHGNIEDSVAPLTIAPIPEETETVPKSPSSLLRPPEILHGPRKSIVAPPLHVDTSQATLAVSPTPTSSTQSTSAVPPECHDVGENGSIACGDQRWWPSSVLPDPYVVYNTLFPTIRGFRAQTRLQKVLSVLAIPVIFCLTITLPVVDNEIADAEHQIKDLSVSASALPAVSPWSAVAADVLRPLSSHDDRLLSPREWNRWITGVQCICAPIFVTSILYRMLPK